MAENQADARIELAVRRLREWQWLAPLTPDLLDLHRQLRSEAKALIQLGLEHPERAAAIGKLVVAYHRLMQTTKPEADEQAKVA